MNTLYISALLAIFSSLHAPNKSSYRNAEIISHVTIPCIATDTLGTTELDTVVYDCNHSFNLGMDYQQERKYALSYDTLKSFVERCPTNPYAPNAFSGMSGDVQNGANGSSPQSWDDFRTWLISALAWNPHDIRYFCADVETIAGSLTGVFGHGPDTSYAQFNRGTNATLAVTRWLIQNPMCDNADLREEYTNSRGSQKENWTNSVDTALVPLDTTLPSLHDLGLDSVLKYAGQLGVQLPHATPSIVESISASPNPVDRQSTIHFTTGREAYITLEVFDLLGRPMEGTQYGEAMNAGDHALPITTVGWPSGTYYARLTTTYGETATVKLVKE